MPPVAATGWKQRMNERMKKDRAIVRTTATPARSEQTSEGMQHNMDQHGHRAMTQIRSVGLIVPQINSAQVVMFLEKAQFFSRTQISFFRIYQHF